MERSDNPTPERRVSSAAKVWLVDLTHTQQIITSDVMPAAVGNIATFTETRVDLTTPIRLFKYPERLAQALDAEMPDVIGFSNYVWNFRLSYKFAHAIKRFNPRAIVVFGGPNYPTIPGEQEEFLHRNPLIDFYVIKEGEVGFSDVLIRLICEGFETEAVKAGPPILGVHWIGADGRSSLPEAAPRLQDLTVIPSPYATGRLDNFFDGKLIPILQTNRGCPFACTFCVEGLSYYNKIYRNSAEKIAAEVEYIGRRMSEMPGGRRDMYISDSNFGMYREDLDTCRALASSMEKYGWPEYINTTTGKNNKERVLEAAKLVKGALRLSGSVQSLDPTVLKLVKRGNISESQILELAMKASEVKANSYSEIILGLPGDSRRAHFESIRTIVNAGFNNVYTWQLMLLPGSELCTKESREEFGLMTKYRVLPRCYGHFSVRDEPIVASEIEEVCVSSNTLSFDDYLACRRLHLVISIFYNDTVLMALVKLLKLYEISPFQWMEALANAPITGRFVEVFESFDRETREELWDSFDTLAEFADRSENVQRYINGEIGNNVLYIHRAMALTRYVDELVELAGRTVRSVLDAAGRLNAQTEEFVNDVLTYAVGRLTNIFMDRDMPVRAVLRYDVQAFESALSAEPIEGFRHIDPMEYSFVFDQSQEDVLTRYQKIYGSGLIGASRILMKLYVSKLLRRAVLEGRITEQPDPQARSYVISGLQDSLS